MATIAFIQHRLGRTDGVSLEVDKWRLILERLGHKVLYLAGNEDAPDGYFIPELYPLDPTTNRILHNATRELKDYPNGKALMDEVTAHAAKIKPRIVEFLQKENIDLVFPNNLVSVGYNLPGMKALVEALEETGVKAVCHNHDFWWEDSGEVYPTCPEVIEFYEKYAPPVAPQISHCVINRIGQRELKARKGVDSRVVPNVFDFQQPSWEADEYNADFREAIGLGPHDLFFLQATRVLDRKGIELAIEVIAELQKPENRHRLEACPLYDGRTFGPGEQIVLVCAGYVEVIGLSGSYAASLQAKADELGVKIIWCADQVKHSRGKEDGRKIYSLWDSYVAADFVTYPSYWEGWGNQLIEAVYAKKPVLLFEYPVYVTDLREAGFEVVSLGTELGPRDDRDLVTVPGERVRAATDQVITYLQEPNLRKTAVEKNFQSAAERYSYEALETIIREILHENGIKS
ncbi:MAG: glycosyltransferase family 4 protein [Opitutales bacterium]|nr:glycosyltransferase family 4 protein [Opitutales bacterium]